MDSKRLSKLERHLAEFVDRDEEISRFCRMLQTEDWAIMVILGGGGIGKSLLLTRMIHECSLRKLLKAEVTWTDTRDHDYLAIMRKIRDDVGADLFGSFTDLVNFYTVPHYELKIKINGSINVGQGAEVEGTTGDIGGVIIKDSMISFPRDDMAVPEAERMARLTDAFISNLAAAIDGGPPLVVFFDAVEKMTVDTRNWVWGELLESLSDGRLRNINFVLCGREEPKLEQLDRDMQLIVEGIELHPLELDHIVDYLEKRGIEENSRTELGEMLMAISKGNPLIIAQSVDAFLELHRKRTRDSE